jgi:hypothetical protein
VRWHDTTFQGEARLAFGRLNFLITDLECGDSSPPTTGRFIGPQFAAVELHQSDFPENGEKNFT